MTNITQTLNTYEQQLNVTAYTGGVINGFRDLSAGNRKGLGMTNKKGVPYLARYAVTAYPRFVNHDDSGTDGNQSLWNGTSQGEAVVRCVFYGAPNSWVTRNACVKIHAAREKFFKDQGIKKKDRGAYDHTIRYGLSSSDSLLRPKKGVHAMGGSDGDIEVKPNVTLGTWDNTTLIYPDDPGGATLHLVGGHNASDEENATAFSALCAGELYLTSRGTVPADSNLESSTTPYKDSILHKLMFNPATSQRDDLVVEVRDQADNPPYDITLADNDQYSLMELGRIQFVAGQATSATAIIEAPLGLFEIRSMMSRTSGEFDGPLVGNIDISVELLGISEMSA